MGLDLLLEKGAVHLDNNLLVKRVVLGRYLNLDTLVLFREVEGEWLSLISNCEAEVRVLFDASLAYSHGVLSLVLEKVRNVFGEVDEYDLLLHDEIAAQNLVLTTGRSQHKVLDSQAEGNGLRYKKVISNFDLFGFVLGSEIKHPPLLRF